MDALRRRISRYIEWLNQQANQHDTYAVVLRAVAQRLTRILDDHPAPRWHREYTQDGEVTREMPEGDGPIYTRKVTEWKRIR